MSVASRRFARPALAAAAALALTSTAGAAAITYTGTDGGTRAASATFTVSGTNLYVTLANTSTSDVTYNTEVLNALFFTLPSTITLTPVSATLSPGSTVTNAAAQPANGNVGGEWAYKSGLSVGGANRGISSTGFGIFGAPNFNGPNLDGNSNVQGDNFGLVSAGDNPCTGQGQIANTEYVQNSIAFSFSGLPTGFSLNSISNVQFQYGTATTDTRTTGSVPNAPAVIPEATTAAFAAPASLLLLKRRSRRFAPK